MQWEGAPQSAVKLEMHTAANPVCCAKINPLQLSWVGGGKEKSSNAQNCNCKNAKVAGARAMQRRKEYEYKGTATWFTCISQCASTG